MTRPSPSSGSPTAEAGVASRPAPARSGVATRPRWAAVAGILAFVAVAVAGVVLRPALPIDETRYLDVAWEMWLSGDWLVPSRNFALYTDKPPLLFWTIDAIWSVTGVSETAARLAGPAYAVAVIVLSGRLARALWPRDDGAGARTMLALSGSLSMALFGGLTMFDAALAAATVGALLALVRAVDTGRTRYWALLGVAVAAGVLAKGPVILIHVGPALLLAPFWARDRAVVRFRALASGGAVALGVALGVVALWLVPAILTGGPAYRDAILWTQSAGRLSHSFAHARPVWFFVAALPILLFPWILVPALWRSAFRVSWRDPGLGLGLAWAGSAFLLFSLISGKQMHYLVPELPAVALIVAKLSRDARPTMLLAALPVVALAAAGLGVAAGIWQVGPAEAVHLDRWWMLAATVLAVAVCGLAVRTRGLSGAAILSLGTLLSVYLAIGLTGLGDAYDAHGIAAAVAPHEAQGIAFYGQVYSAEFNFAGRLTTPVANPLTGPELAAWRAAHPDGVVIARLDRQLPPGPPSATFAYRAAPYGVWNVADGSGPVRDD